MDRNSDKAGGQKESTRRKLGPDGSVVLFLEVSVGPTKLVPVPRTPLVLFNQLMSRSAEDSPLGLGPALLYIQEPSRWAEGAREAAVSVS